MPSNDQVYMRQSLLFHPDEHRERLGRIVLIGAGAIGSAMALTLAKMGVGAFSVYDADTIAIHNGPNQVLYSLADAGTRKVDALIYRLHDLTSAAIAEQITTYPQRCTVDDLADYDTVIIATDDLPTRRVFWRAAQEYEHIGRYLDLRMGGMAAVRYAHERLDGFFPFADKYEPLVNGSIPADADPCGARSFLPTALMAAALGGYAIAAWGRGEAVPWETSLFFDCSTDPFMLKGESPE